MLDPAVGGNRGSVTRVLLIWADHPKSDGRKTLDTPSSCAFLKEPLLFIENNPQSSEYCALCLGNLTPRTLCFPGIEAQSRDRLN
jgi:hypothetical protein